MINRFEFKVGEQVLDWQAGGAPVGALFRHKGDGYFTLEELPVAKPEVGDVVETAEQAKLLPVGTVVVEVDYVDTTSTSVKVGHDRWMYHSVFADRHTSHEDEAFEAEPHRVVFIPDSADAGTGRTAA